MDLLSKTDNKIARMATIAAILYHKMDHFSWTGFYLLHNNKLIVVPYQGPIACQLMERDHRSS
jgi:GAF domain-containing protein